MVQLLTPWGDPWPGNGPPVRRFLSNYFDLLLCLRWYIVDSCVSDIFVEVLRCDEPLRDNMHWCARHISSGDRSRFWLLEGEAQSGRYRVIDDGFTNGGWAESHMSQQLSPSPLSVAALRNIGFIYLLVVMCIVDQEFVDRANCCHEEKHLLSYIT